MNKRAPIALSGIKYIDSLIHNKSSNQRSYNQDAGEHKKDQIRNSMSFIDK
jgi:hypothetical protein